MAIEYRVWAVKQAESTVIEFSGEMRGELAERFNAEAERRNRTLAELAADLLETIAKDNLFDAVLDD